MTRQEFTQIIPQTLREVPNWICWKIEERDGKPTKIPVNPKTLGNAQSNNPDTWGTLEEALTACTKNLLSGVGFMFDGSGIVGVDIDKCRNPETGELTEQAQDILSTLNGYSEVSPSGKGVHVIIKGKLPETGRRSGNVEMYESGRFFTVTGKHLTDYSCDIEERTEQLRAVHSKYIKKPEPPQLPALKTHTLDESELWQKALNSKTGYKLKALFDGNWTGLYPSQSEADAGLCQILAFWYQGDTAAIDSKFRQSALYRKKWDQMHGSQTYGQITIANALRTCKEFYVPKGEYGSKQDTKEKVPELELISLNTVKSEPVQWLWYPYIPKGKLTLLQGNPGEGKTFFALNLAAIVSKGDPMPGENQRQDPGMVLYQSAEDSLSDTIKPRLEAAEADCSRIFCIDEANASLSFRDDRIEKMMQQLHPSLVVFDPIQGFLGAETDMHRANEVRPVLTRLLRLAEQYNCAVILLMHLSKSQASNKLYRGLGSIDIVAAARSVLLCGCSPNNPSERGIVHIKSSLAPAGDTIGFSLDKDNGFQWKGKSDLTADAILNPVREAEPDRKLERAKELLLAMLEGGKEVAAAAIYEKAAEMEISDRTVKRAKAELKVQAKKSGLFRSSHWVWYIEECQGGQGKVIPLIRTQKEMAPFGGTLDNQGFYEEGQWHPSANAKEDKKSLAPFGESIDNTTSDRRRTDMFFTYTQSDSVASSDDDWWMQAEKLCERSVST